MKNVIVGTMHERKLKMAGLASDGFIVLPGGFGTFEEVCHNHFGVYDNP